MQGADVRKEEKEVRPDRGSHTCAWQHCLVPALAAGSGSTSLCARGAADVFEEELHLGSCKSLWGPWRLQRREG